MVGNTILNETRVGKAEKIQHRGNVFDNRNRNYFDVLVLITSF
jgi:hypothetical protein